MPSPKHIILIGFKASGKTTVGRLLAKTLNYQFIDTDEILCELNTSTNISQLYASLGEEKFRSLEHQLLKSLSPKSLSVIATGGGVGANQDNHSILKQLGTIINLYCSLDDIKTRLPQWSNMTLYGQQSLETMYAYRQPLYQNNANIIIDSSGKDVWQLVTDIKFKLGIS